MAERILMNELNALQKEKWVHAELRDDNIFIWDLALIVVNPDSLYYGGYFKGTMKFPANYPYAPPKFRFDKSILHPNIYPDGRLCISILHPPGHDEMSGELASERWTPAQRVESVLISILSLLDDPECSSPANVDAAVLLRDDSEAYRQRVYADVETSQSDIPEGFEMPTHETTAPQPVEKEDHDFWADSDADSDVFGGSDSDDDLATVESSSDAEMEDSADESTPEESAVDEETPRKREVKSPGPNLPGISSVTPSHG
ncbi:unnamed protein product [Penicillium olsonii]|nr:unnamed protein product [Penicillium olsonii]